MTDGAPPSLDRRQRKSRAALQGALLALISRKPYDEITIDDVVRTADVARATFYAHYHDKSELLAAATQMLIDELGVAVTTTAWARPPAYDGSGVLLVLEHVDRRRDLYRLLITGAGGAAPRAALRAAMRDVVIGILTPVAEHGPGPRLPLAVTATAFVGALLGTVEAWLEGSIDADAQTLTRWFIRQQMAGLEWALGYEPAGIPPSGSVAVEERVPTR